MIRVRRSAKLTADLEPGCLVPSGFQTRIAACSMIIGDALQCRTASIRLGSAAAHVWCSDVSEGSKSVLPLNMPVAEY